MRSPSAPTSSWNAAARRGAEWLLRQVSEPQANPLSEITWSCKVPWALLACGERAAALALLRRCREACDDLVDSNRPCESGTSSLAYAMGWLTTAARIAEAYDAANTFYDALRQYMCPRQGGGVAECRAAGERSDTVYFDAALQGAGLHAAIAMGDLSAGRALGDLMVRLINEQPDPAAGFYMLYAPGRGHLREVDEATRSQRLLVRGTPRQPYANLGFGLQGLCRLFEATGDRKYLAAAAAALDLLLSDGHRGDVLAHGQNHKVGHAAILLYRHLRHDRYREAALGIGERVTSRIGAEGCAWADVFFESIDAQPPLLGVRTTCDSVLWLRQIADEVDAGSCIPMEQL